MLGIIRSLWKWEPGLENKSLALEGRKELFPETRGWSTDGTRDF